MKVLMLVTLNMTHVFQVESGPAQYFIVGSLQGFAPMDNEGKRPALWQSLGTPYAFKPREEGAIPMLLGNGVEIVGWAFWAGKELPLSIRYDKVKKTMGEAFEEKRLEVLRRKEKAEGRKKPNTRARAV